MPSRRAGPSRTGGWRSGVPGSAGKSVVGEAGGWAAMSIRQGCSGNVWCHVKAVGGASAASVVPLESTKVYLEATSEAASWKPCRGTMTITDEPRGQIWDFGCEESAGQGQEAEAEV